MPNESKKCRCAGQDHPRAELTDREVELMRQMHEEFPPGHPKHLGYRQLAKVFEISRCAVRNICKYWRRTG